MLSSIWVSALASQVLQVVAPVQVFVAPDFLDQAKQEAMETAFQHAVLALNRYGFDSFAEGSIGSSSLATADFVVSQPAQEDLFALRQGPGPDLYPVSDPNVIFGEYTKGEDLEITILPPRREVGLWVVDSEANRLDSSGNPSDWITFYSAQGTVLFTMALPSHSEPLTVNSNQFVGLISSDPIARIAIKEALDDEDGVGIDDVQVGVLDPTCGGSFGVYGDGCPGEYLVSPRLTVSGCLDVGDHYKVSVANGAPTDAIAQLLVGGSATSIPIRYGCFFLVAGSASFPLLSPIPIPLAALESGITTQVPTGLQTLTVTMQVFVPPPPGLPKFSATNAIELHFP